MGGERVDNMSFAVTGGSGFVGRRLVEMLVERGASKVVSFDIAPVNPDPLLQVLNEEQLAKVDYVVGDITKYDNVKDAFRGVDCVFHIAALVGPFYPKDLYKKVNYDGTVNVIKACKELGIKKLVGSSSPSTRFDGNDVSGKREDELQIREPGQFLEPYAETKAMGEIALREACSESLLTVAIAPHQVYGPRDPLFLPNLLAANQKGQLRVFGNGNNEVSLTHVDNYCHGLILGANLLTPGSPILGKFYIITDGGKYKLWRLLDDAGMEMGYPSLFNKFKLPFTMMIVIAYILRFAASVTGLKFRLTPFTVKMLTIHRWFDISAAETDLGYKPVISHADGWAETKAWFVKNKVWWENRAKATL